MRPRGLVTALLLGLVVAVTAGGKSRRGLLDGGVSGAIVNGKPAPAGRYPWVVSIRSNVDREHMCGGTLIAPRIVMTAAHCFHDDGKLDKSALNPEVRIGLYRDVAGSQPGSQPGSYEVRQTIKTLIHPFYTSGGFFESDITLLLLDTPSTTQLPKLPAYTPKPKLPVPSGTRLNLVGWGNLGAGDYPEVLQEAVVTLQSLEFCQEFNTYLQSFYSNTQLCAGNAPGFNQDACDGDSGGPLFAKGSVPADDLVLGIVSNGQQCTSSGVDMPGSYTDVAALVPWIRSAVWNLTKSDGPREGRVYGDPLVQGFDGSLSVFKGTPGRMQILTSPQYHLTGVLKRVQRAVGWTALGSITLDSISNVVVMADGQSMKVRLNGRPVKAGSTRCVKGGSLRFLAPRPRMNHHVTIQQPGVSVRIIQPYYKKYGSYATWLDVWVTLTAPPTGRLGGVLGATFKGGLRTAGTHKAGATASLTTKA